jgi:hypothetical protein
VLVIDAHVSAKGKIRTYSFLITTQGTVAGHIKGVRDDFAAARADLQQAMAAH